MDSNNTSSGVSNNKRTPTTSGKKKIITKNNADIAADLEAFTGKEGYVVVANYGMAEFIHSTVKEAENAAGAASDSTNGSGKVGASKLGPTGKIDTGMLVIALQNDEVATISANKKEIKETQRSEEEREEK